MLVSVIIRTYNEDKYLRDVLSALEKQEGSNCKYEVILVDSGSTDETIAIAEYFEAQIVYIQHQEFTFGKSLNKGCEAAKGDLLIFLSGHCIPVDKHWLRNLVSPFSRSDIAYAYGRQCGGQVTRYSESQIFRKYYPEGSSVPQDGYFCNNANACIKKSVWLERGFDEKLTGLEDMEMAKYLTRNGWSIAYEANAAVYHLHEESWHKVRKRFEREAIALRAIMPEIQVSFADFVRFLISSILIDLGSALKAKKISRVFWGVIAYRIAQYWGVYRGNHMQRKISAKMREEYFFPV